MDDAPTPQPEDKRSRSILPAEFQPGDVVAVCSVLLPYVLAPLQQEPGSLAVADYSVRGLESQIAIKAKTLDELVCCCGADRHTFEHALMSMLAYPCRAVIVEASWAELELGEWRYAMKPAAVVSSILAWIGAGVPFILAGNRERAQTYTSKLLYLAARRRWRELRSLAGGIVEPFEGLRT